MRSFEFALTLASGFAPPAPASAPAGAAVGGETGLLERARPPAPRDAQIDLFENDPVQGQANPICLAGVNCGS